MTCKPPFPGLGFFVLGLLTGIVLALGLEAKSQDIFADSPVVLELTASHSVAVPGQDVWVSWKPTKGSTLITRCEFTQSPEGLPATTTTVTKTKTNFDLTMPDAPVFRMHVVCYYPDAKQPTGEGSFMAGDLIERTTREAILAADLAGPTCYPAPVGSGSKVYGKSYLDEDNRDAACVLWFCGDIPRSFCFRWDLADWSLAALAAVKDTAGLDEKWKAAPWHSTSLRERALVAALFEENRTRYFAAPNGTYTTRPIYAKNPDGTRGLLVKTSRVAVGAECNCFDRATYGTAKYCSVAGKENALAPPALLPGPVAGPDGSFSGGSYTLCASR